jgi:hypothetical protein
MESTIPLILPVTRNAKPDTEIRLASIELKGRSNMPNTENEISLSSVVVCSEENLACDLQGEAVLLNLKSGTYFGLNAMGTRIWELIQKPAKVSDVYQHLLNEYEVDPGECQEELLSFLGQLRTNDLIKVQVTDKN